MMTNIISFVILLGLLAGRRLGRRQPKRHAIWMSSVIGADLLLVGYLVFGHKALSKVSAEMPLLLMIHIFFAVSTVVFYGLAFRSGINLLRGRSARISMKILDRWIVTLRSLTFATSVALQFL